MRYGQRRLRPLARRRASKRRPALGGHAGAKAVGAGAVQVTGIECTFHSDRKTKSRDIRERPARVLSGPRCVNRRFHRLELDFEPFCRTAPLPVYSSRRALLSESLWSRCLRVLESELPEQQFNTWVRPLQSIGRDGELRLLAPNRYVIDWVSAELAAAHQGTDPCARRRRWPPRSSSMSEPAPAPRRPCPSPPATAVGSTAAQAGCCPRRASAAPGARQPHQCRISPSTASSRARATTWPRPPRCRSPAIPGKAYNPLFIYGGVGLGKTHLMHAVANLHHANAIRTRGWPTCTASASSATWSRRCSTTRSTISRPRIARSMRC